MFSPRFMTLVAMIIAAAATRVLPHPWGFTAVGAMCLFGGAKFKNFWAALAVPMIALLISDVAIAYTQYGGRLSTMTPDKYWMFAIVVVMGMALRNRANPLAVGGMAVAASATFFLLSNFMVWTSGKMYPLTADGLLTCYIKALPFARGMFAGDLFYSALLFGGFHFLKEVWPALNGSRGELAYQPASGARSL